MTGWVICPFVIASAGKLIPHAADENIDQTISKLKADGSADLQKLVDVAKALLTSRHAIQRFLPEALFADPGRDLLLELFIADAKGRPMRVSAACIAARVPPTTGLRWIANLKSQGLVLSAQDPLDARSTILRLSGDATISMKNYLQKVAGLFA